MHADRKRRDASQPGNRKRVRRSSASAPAQGRDQGEPEVPGYEFPARTICSAKLNDRLR